MPNSKSYQRYDLIAITLHWIMAICIILMLGSGFAFDFIDMPKSFKFDLYQWHKSLGIVLLIVVFIRIGWRLFHRPPDEPEELSKRDAILSRVGHWVLYVMMVAMPIVGWMMVSSSPYGLPTFIFGLFEWPHIPGLSNNETINTMAKQMHWIGGWLFLSIIIIHTLAVVKHYYFDNINLLRRMGIGSTKKE
jgi:cytochrome b561